MEEERIFIQLMKMPDGRVSISVGGGSAIKDLEERAANDLYRLRAL